MSRQSFWPVKQRAVNLYSEIEKLRNLKDAHQPHIDSLVEDIDKEFIRLSQLLIGI